MKRKTAIDLLKGFLGANVSDAEVTQIVKDLELGKAAPEHAVTLTSAEEHDDVWTEGELHRMPSREKINVGPSQASSGGGAEKMVAQYSSPAPQRGLVIEAEALCEMLAPLTGTMKALQEGQKIQTSLLVAMAKAEDEEEDDEEEDEEESEVVEINEAKAKGLLKKARKLLERADIEKSMAEDEEDVALRTAGKAKSRATRKAAARLLVKARLLAFASGKKGVELRKSIKELIAGNRFLKADINVVQEEEEDEEEEEEEEGEGKAKAKAKAKAKEGDKGNQADHAEEDGNQADAAKAAAPVISNSDMEQVRKALEGITVLNGKVNTIMDTIAGRPAVAAAAPVVDSTALMKGDMNALALQLSDRIEQGIDDGYLDNAAAMRARDLLSKYQAVRKGVLNEKTFNDQLAVAPQAVKDVFKLAA